MEFKEIGCEGVDWIHGAQYKNQWRTFVSTVMNLQVPDEMWKFRQ
jgi:hypothetical protein